MKLSNMLAVERCPHCQIDKPSLVETYKRTTSDAVTQGGERWWKVYVCNRCGGLVTAWASTESGDVQRIYPQPPEVNSAIPDPAREFLKQALETLHAPAAAVMVAASAVDAMLKAKGYEEGSLYARIKQAAADHLITNEMAEWAHEVRLEANAQRHADQETPLPDSSDANRSIAFTQALGQFLFVLPDSVEKGRV